jgi:predicted metal-dependent phosphoesterase TrpH
MPADLHIHTNLSDGTDPPEKIVEMAHAAGLTTIAITDHDLVDGISPAVIRGSELGVEVVPGIEFTTEYQDAELHILGYYFDHTSQVFQAAIVHMQEDRVLRINKMAEKLQGLKIDIRPEEILRIANNKVPGRPHVARALLEKGVVTSIKEAFNRFLADKGPAYVPHFKLLPKEAIALIKQAGGIAVMAHPATCGCDAMIPDLVSAGLRGLEVYYSGHRPEQTAHYAELADKYGLLKTGGSDYHGSNSGREIRLGDTALADDLMDKIRNEHLHRD